MHLWPWDFVRPIRVYFAKRRRSRWKQNYSKGTCPSCRLPFDNGKKRCVVDSCGHDRCYSCLCVQDTCPTCIRDVVVYRTSKKYSRSNDKSEKRKSNETPMRVLMNITNEPSLCIPVESGPSGIYQRGQNVKRLSQTSSLDDDSFEKIVSNEPECFMPLKPLYFEVPQPENENSFLYRPWVFEEINKIIASDLKGVVLAGDEGCGKTTLILQLVDWSFFGRKRKSGIINDGLLNNMMTFENLASKVVGYHFCQEDCSETCLIPDFVHSLAAQLCQAPQLEEYRNFLRQEVGFQQILSLDSCIVDPDSAFRNGILKPLCSLKKPFLTSELLVIDSVHEAENQRCSFISFLVSHIEEFPSWLKIVLSVKTSDVNKLSILPLYQINLNCSELKVQEDLRRYARCRISNCPVIEANISNFGHEDQISRLVDYLVNGGQASFLYLRLVLDLFQQNYLVIKSSSFNVIPVSLDEVFTLTFNLKFPSMTTFNKVKPVLEICLASPNPLTALEIFYAFELASVVPKLNWTEFTQTLNTLYGILIQRKDQSLMISHSSLRDWLKRNKKFFCDIRNGHNFLALLITRMRFPLTKDKMIELAYHISHSNVFKQDKQLQAFWMHQSSIDLSKVFIDLRAVFWTDSEIIHLFLESGANVNSTLTLNENSPILNAVCKRGYLEIISLLLKFGASVDKSNNLGVTPLMVAAESGHLKIIEVLVKAGAKVQLKDKVNRCALDIAAEKGFLNIVEYLIEPKYWDSLNQRSLYIEQAIIAASGAGRFQVCEFLIKVINNVSDTIQNQKIIGSSLKLESIWRLFMKDHLNSRADYLRLVAYRGHIPILKAMIDEGIDLNSKDQNGRTALFWACINHKTDAARILLEKGADANEKDNEDLMPIHIVSRNGKSDMISLLLKHDANPEIVDGENKTALVEAITANNLMTAFELLKYGVKMNDQAYFFAEANPHLYCILLCKLFSEGRTLYKESKFTGAIQRFQEGLKKCPSGSYQRLRSQFIDQIKQTERNLCGS